MTVRSGFACVSPQPYQRGGAHGAPEVEIAVMVAGSVNVVARRAEPGHDQQAVSVAQQPRDDRAAFEAFR